MPGSFVPSRTASKICVQEIDAKMTRMMLKSKIHRATVTATELHYEGSIAIDEVLLEKADIIPGEQVQVLNLETGSRFITYAIWAKRGSGTIMLNGPAARLGSVGDRVIIITYSPMSDEEARSYKAKVVLVNRANKPVRKSES